MPVWPPTASPDDPQGEAWADYQVQLIMLDASSWLRFIGVKGGPSVKDRVKRYRRVTAYVRGKGDGPLVGYPGGKRIGGTKRKNDQITLTGESKKDVVEEGRHESS
jgi:hypothetical protein